MAMFVAEKCPKCGQYAAFPATKIIKIDGQMYGPIIWKCDACKAEQPEDEVIQYVKENMMV